MALLFLSNMSSCKMFQILLWVLVFKKLHYTVLKRYHEAFARTRQKIFWGTMLVNRHDRYKMIDRLHDKIEFILCNPKDYNIDLTILKLENREMSIYLKLRRIWHMFDFIGDHLSYLKTLASAIHHVDGLKSNQAIPHLTL